MENFQAKVAFITGAASGIGLAITRALLNAGANVMMADIDAEGLETARSSLDFGADRIQTVVCDVRKAESVQAAAQASIKAFEKVHLVFNNAGVGLGGQAGRVPLKDWQWITDINLLGVIYGVEAFVPHIKKHGEGGYIINTASMAGHIAMAGMSPYHATKFAVVGYSESLAQELVPQNIGVSVLCPTWVQSNIHNTAAKRPSVEGETVEDTSPLYLQLKNLVENGMTADDFAALVLKSIQAKRLYVFNDASARHDLVKQQARILKDFDACLTDLDT